MRRRTGSAALSLLLALTVCIGSARAVALQPGDILVSGGTSGVEFISRVDPVTGAQTMVSQGGLLVGVRCLAVGNDGFIYVGKAVGTTYTILRIDPADGSQVIFASPPNLAMGFSISSSMIAHTNGRIYWSGAFRGDVIEMSLPGGALAQLTTDAFLVHITEGPDGAIYGATCLEADLQTPCGGDGSDNVVALRNVPGSGTLTAVGFGAIGKPRGIAFDDRDSMYVESTNDRRVFRFGPSGASGALTGLELGYTANGMVGHPDGNLYLTHNHTIPAGRVDRLDPVTATRTTLSDFGPTTSLLGITVVRDWTVPAQRRSWGQIKQIYR